MGIAVRPTELQHGSMRVAAQAACLDAVRVVDRLEAAAAAAPGTELASAALAAAEALRTALLRCRSRLAGCGWRLDDAAAAYVSADALAVRRAS